MIAFIAIVSIIAYLLVGFLMASLYAYNRKSKSRLDADDFAGIMVLYPILGVVMALMYWGGLFKQFCKWWLEVLNRPATDA